MGFLKKHLLFCIVVIVSVAVFLAGAYLAYSQFGDVQKAQSSLASVEGQLGSVLNQDPAPSEANLAAAEQNLEELINSLAELRNQLQSEAVLNISEDGVSVIAGIQQYISRFQREVSRHKNEEGDVVPIQTPNNFAFGFEQYIGEAPVPDDAKKAATLDKQRQILSHLMSKLIEASPQAINAVQREVLEVDRSGDRQGFAISPEVSARVPGAIDTFAFRLTFNGYTNSLRQFLNGLAEFELPIVVRSIEVKRPSGSETVVNAPRRPARGNFDDLFGGGTATPTQQQPAAEAQKPVIEENVSEFIVILEFIEVVLPEANTQEVSDPA